MPEKVYKIAVWFTTPEGEDITTTVRISANSPKEAQAKVKNWYKSQQYPPKDLMLLSCQEVKNLDEYALDILWESNKDIYLSIWEPDITTAEMLKNLKRRYPQTWESLINWNL